MISRNLTLLKKSNSIPILFGESRLLIYFDQWSILIRETANSKEVNYYLSLI